MQVIFLFAYRDTYYLQCTLCYIQPIDIKKVFFISMIHPCKVIKSSAAAILEIVHHCYCL